MVTTRLQSQSKNKAATSPESAKPAVKQPRKKQTSEVEEHQEAAQKPLPLSSKDRNAGMGGLSKGKGARKPDSHPIASLPTSPASDAAPAIDFPLPGAVVEQEQQPAAAAVLEPAAPVAQEPVPAEQRQMPAAAALPSQPKLLSRENRLLKPLPAEPIVCDKLPDGTEPTAVEVEYVPREALAPVECDPAAALEAALAGMESSDWVEATRALGVLRQLAAHHTDVVAPQLERVLAGVLKGVKNLRSSLCKTAIMAAADLFSTYSDALLPLIDIGGAAKPATSLLAQLLLKAASNDKKFVVEEAQRALQMLAQSLCPAQVLLHLLPFCEHKNPKVRGRAAAVLEASASRLDVPALAAFGLASLLRPGARLLTDNTPEAREAAKRLLVQIKTAVEDPMVASTLLQESKSVVVMTAAPEGGAAAPPPGPWEAFCQATLGGSAALVVLKAC